MRRDPSAGFERLRKALSIHAEWQRQDPRPAAAELLGAWPDLADLLEPLLTDAPAEAEVPDAADWRAEGSSAERTDEPVDAVLAAGQRVGEFTIEAELGRGAMGIVYRARQTGLAREVALKVLPPSGQLDPKSVARFRRESTLLAALDHDGIVEVLTVGRDRGLEFFAMEIIGGPPLSDVLRALRGRDPASLAATELDRATSQTRAIHDPRTAAPGSASDSARVSSSTGRPGSRQGFVAQAVQLAARIADALAHAHEAGVLHRDVKPGNILLRQDGTPVLSDFGLARRDSSAPSLTRTGDFAGTPYYVAPEQVLDRPDALDGRVDVFSLGVTLYELLTLVRPFEGPTNHDVVQAILSSEPDDPRRHNAKIPRELAAIVLKALEKSPGRRYHSAAAFRDDLRAFLELRPVQAKRPGLANRTWRAARREPLRALLIVVLTLGIPALAATSGYLLATAEAVDVGENTMVRERVQQLLSQGTQLAEVRATDASLAVLDEAVQLDPSCTEALAMQVLALARDARMDEIRSRIERSSLPTAQRKRIFAAALEVAGQQDSAAELVAELPPPTTAVDWFVTGLAELERIHRGASDRWQIAADAFERAMLLEEDSQLLYMLHLAHALGHGGKNVAAERVRRVADVLSSRWPQFGYADYWAGFAVRAHDPERYERSLLRAIDETESAEHRIHYNLGTGYMNEQRYEDACAMLQVAVERNPRDAEAWANLAGSYYRSRQFEAALEPLERALEITPKRAMFHSNKAAMFTALKRHDEAERSYEQALRLDGSERYAATGYPALLKATGRLDHGIEFVESVLAGGSEKVGLYALLTRLHMMLGNRAGMLDALTRCRKVRPDDVNLIRQHALLNFQAGNRAEALTDLAALAERAPSHQYVLRTRAQLLAQDGKLEDARTSLREAIDSGTVTDPAPETWLELARRHLALGEKDQALAAAAFGKRACRANTNAAVRDELTRLAPR